MNVLISGVASDIGFGAGRILRDWGWSGLILGIDIHSEYPGEFIFDKTSISPRAAESHYINWVKHYIEQNNIGLFIPTSEAEIQVLSQYGVRKIGGASIILANKKAIDISTDKRTCMIFLEEQRVRVPKNGVVGETVPLSYPVIVKPRSGQGSKQVQKINNLLAFGQFALQGKIWQEYLEPDDEEYTCPIYHSANRGTHVLILRRTLTGGSTGRGVVVNEPRIEQYVSKIAKTLELDGAINVQLRMTKEGPCLFEINPRISSTVVFRDKMGFCDLRWWIQDTVGSDNTPALKTYCPPVPGTRFFRGVQEYITLR